MRCQWLGKESAIVANLATVYAQATDTDIIAGMRWYPVARKIVREWSEHYGYSTDTVACVIAAISPQVDWERNLITADDVLADRAISIGGALPTNVSKARRILSDHATSTLEYFPHGPKVASFALNLAGNDTAVTIDGHAIQAALDDVTSTVTLRWTPYMIFAGAYECAARKAGHSNSDFQAIVWVTWKRLHPKADKLRQRTQWSAIGEF